jgi:hypothetical protein
MSQPRSLITVLLFCALLPPGLVRAAQEPVSEPAPGEAVPAPPLVPVEAVPEPDVPAAPQEAPAPRQGSSIPLGARVFGELLGAGVTGATGGLVGAIAGYNLAECTSDGCFTPFFIGMLVGTAVGVPVGVYSAGRLMGVQADASALGGSYLGMGVGGGAALLASILINDEERLSLLAVPVGALVGAIVGFELSASSSNSDAQARPGPTLRLAPTVGATPRGGFMGGLSGSF